MKQLVLALICILARIPPGLAEERCNALGLRDVAVDIGLDFTHESGARGLKHLPESMGSGLAWIDYDGDGWMDLYVVQSGSFPPDQASSARDRLFRNRGDGTFEDVTDRAGIQVRGYGQGALAADLDGDHWTDLYVTQFGPDIFLRNRGDGTFENATASFGLGLSGWSSSAAAADADGDGDLDLYVTRYLVYDPEQELFCGDLDKGRRKYCDPVLFDNEGDQLLRNDGDHFTNITSLAGLASETGKGLGVLFADLDGDFRPDLYVANDLTPNFLFQNVGSDGGLAFDDVSLFSGAAANREGLYEAGMGLALGDLDDDGDPEILVTNFDVETNTLYQNQGDLQFEDVSAGRGFGVPSFNLLGFGIALADFDLDGHLDAWVANGHIFEQPTRENVTHAQRDLLLVGDGKGAFRELSCPELAANPQVGRGLAVGDMDNDGDVDVAVSNNGGPLQLWRNGISARNSANWLGVHLPASAAVGSVVQLDSGDARSQRRWLTAGGSYQSSNDLRQVFGLGALRPKRLWITWPGGRRIQLVNPPTGKNLIFSSQSPLHR